MNAQHEPVLESARAKAAESRKFQDDLKTLGERGLAADRLREAVEQQDRISDRLREQADRIVEKIRSDLRIVPAGELHDDPCGYWPSIPTRSGWVRFGERIGPYVTGLVIAAVFAWCLFVVVAASVWAWGVLT